MKKAWNLSFFQKIKLFTAFPQEIPLLGVITQKKPWKPLLPFAMALRAPPALTVPAWTSGVPPQVRGPPRHPPGPSAPAPAMSQPCPTAAPLPQGGTEDQGWGCPRCPPVTLLLAGAVVWVQAGSRQRFGFISDREFVCRTLTPLLSSSQVWFGSDASPCFAIPYFAIFRLVIIVCGLSLTDYR